MKCTSTTARGEWPHHVQYSILPEEKWLIDTLLLWLPSVMFSKISRLKSSFSMDRLDEMTWDEIGGWGMAAAAAAAAAAAEGQIYLCNQS